MYASHSGGEIPAFMNKAEACSICICTETTSNDKSITFLIIRYIIPMYFKIFSWVSLVSYLLFLWFDKHIHILKESALLYDSLWVAASNFLWRIGIITESAFKNTQALRLRWSGKMISCAYCAMLHVAHNQTPTKLILSEYTKLLRIGQFWKLYRTNRTNSFLSQRTIEINFKEPGSSISTRISTKWWLSCHMVPLHLLTEIRCSSSHCLECQMPNRW